MEIEDPKAVKYLIFEGGGAQGAAYLGAVAALMDPRVSILKHTRDGLIDSSVIKGLAGSSSGAVTATLLSCGYLPEQIAQFVQNSFLLFEEPIPRSVPFVPATANERRSVTGAMPARQERYKLLKAASVVVDSSSIWRGIGGIIRLVMGSKADVMPYSYLIEHPGTALWLLAEDCGIFAGSSMRSALDAMIGLKTPDKSNRPRQNITFKEHADYHKVKLVLAGTDLETGFFQSFSVDKTPDFVVADAARIAMGFPFMFKPVVIPSGKYEGTWVDSGVVMNFPLHAFKEKVAAGEKVLGFRLRKMKREKIADLYSYILALAGIRYEAGMLSQVATKQSNEIVVEIDASKIGVFDIVYDPVELREAVANGVKAVMKRFTGSETLTDGYHPRF